MRAAVGLERRLLEAALAYPGAHEEHPWGERVVKVKGKIFVFLGAGEGGRLTVTTKLPRSGAAALSLPFAAPTGYGLGRSGWVTARFPQAADAPEGLLLQWLDESYRAVAPKGFVAALDGGPAARPRVKAAKPRAKTPKAAKPRAKTPKDAMTRAKAARPRGKAAKPRARAGD